MTDRDDPGQEAIKTAREKFAKKKDEPAGIASAKVGSKSIKESLDETDPQRKSQVLPQMFNQFSRVQGILKSSGSGQQGQSQQMMDMGYPEYYQDLDSTTKNLLTAALTHALCILVRNYGYDMVLENFKRATTGFYTQQELESIGVDDYVLPFTYRFDTLCPDYQDVVSGALVLLYSLVEKYGEAQVPFIQPIYKPLTYKIPEPLVDGPSKYSILEFYTKEELPEIRIDGLNDIIYDQSSNTHFVYIANNKFIDGDIVLYNLDAESKANAAILGLTPNTYYYVTNSFANGFKLTTSYSIDSVPPPLQIFPTEQANAVFNRLEDYSGYGEWYRLDGTLEYSLRNEFLPDFETVDELVVYLSAYSFSYDLFFVIPEFQLDINLLAKLLDRYTRKIENDYMDYTTGWGMSADTDAENTDWNPNTGGSGNNQNMLSQILPTLKQLTEKAKTEHLSKSVLEKGKMKKLLQNLEQKKSENKRMATLIDSGVGGGLLGGLLNGSGGLGGLQSLGGLGEFGGAAGLSGLGSISQLSGIGSIFQGGDISGLFSQITTRVGQGSGENGQTFPTFTPPPEQVYSGDTTIETLTENEKDRIIITTYRTYLLRDPSADEIAAWKPTLTSMAASDGIDIASQKLANMFVDSDEYKTIQKYRVYKPVMHAGYNLTAVVTNKYIVYLKREPEYDGLNFWIEQMKIWIDSSGYEIAVLTLDQYFENSEEYKTKRGLNPIDPEAIVRQKYILRYKKEPDQETSIYWQNVFISDVNSYGYSVAVANLDGYFAQDASYKKSVLYQSLIDLPTIEGLL